MRGIFPLKKKEKSNVGLIGVKSVAYVLSVLVMQLHQVAAAFRTAAAALRRKQFLYFRSSACDRRIEHFDQFQVKFGGF